MHLGIDDRADHIAYALHRVLRRHAILVGACGRKGIVDLDSSNDSGSEWIASPRNRSGYPVPSHRS